ncbi:unnamed protein product [Caenorhabditis sp. 36 PRJEB53466]|nr:unnamed protein product [Caenorhabditis sp. 36 PRJEB53466]
MRTLFCLVLVISTDAPETNFFLFPISQPCSANRPANTNKEILGVSVRGIGENPWHNASNSKLRRDGRILATPMLESRGKVRRRKASTWRGINVFEVGRKKKKKRKNASDCGERNRYCTTTSLYIPHS